jgi:hypothetical protein
VGVYACVLALITVTTTFITPEIAARDQTTWPDRLTRQEPAKCGR